MVLAEEQGDRHLCSFSVHLKVFKIKSVLEFLKDLCSFSSLKISLSSHEGAWSRPLMLTPQVGLRKSVFHTEGCLQSQTYGSSVASLRVGDQSGHFSPTA